MGKVRKEKDSLGVIEVPFDCYWGAQTQRSLENFKIGSETFPKIFIQSYSLLKKCVCEVNESLNLVESKKAKAIIQACDEILKGGLEDQFPLSIWQTGSGTQTNMNLNEVIANRAIEIKGGERGDQSIHPNDDVNCSQSTNDSFPTAMNIACALYCRDYFLPSLKEVITTLKQKQEQFSDVVKIGRTHLMDATPLTVGQEVSAWVSLLEKAQTQINHALELVYELPIGGTAVGTGLNTKKGYDKKVVELIKKQTQIPFKVKANKFEGLSAHTGLISLSSALRNVSAHLIKISNDIRFLSSGPRCGLSEFLLPVNEPGSSIMPGKVNPTHCEAVIMLCWQVIGHDVSVCGGESFGNFQLNVSKPLIIYNVLNSLKLLSTGLFSFNEKCLKGMRLNEKKIKEYCHNSLMLITALTPHIGYDKASEVVKKAYESGDSLKKEAVRLGYVTQEEFDQWVNPLNMTSPSL